MAKASATIDLAVSADEVWQLIGGFNSLPDWIPFIPHSELSEGGRVRRLKTVDGVVVVERLQMFDHGAKTYSYSFVEAPFPVTGYLATIKVEPLGEGARVTWSGRFEPVGVSDAEAEATFAAVYQGGIDALHARFQA